MDLQLATTFLAGRVDGGDFVPFDYEEPGKPTQRFGEASIVRMEGSGGKVLAVGLWRVPEPSTSPIYTSQLGDETFVVLEGKVTIELVESGERLDYGVGDVVSWSKGTATRWTIHEPFKKFFVVAQPD